MFYLFIFLFGLDFWVSDQMSKPSLLDVDGSWLALFSFIKRLKYKYVLEALYIQNYITWIEHIKFDIKKRIEHIKFPNVFKRVDNRP